MAEGERIARFVATSVTGFHLIDQERPFDERGLFPRTWCAHEPFDHGHGPRPAQGGVSFNHRRAFGGDCSAPLRGAVPRTGTTEVWRLTSHRMSA